MAKTKPISGYKKISLLEIHHVSKDHRESFVIMCLKTSIRNYVNVHDKSSEFYLNSLKVSKQKQ